MGQSPTPEEMRAMMEEGRVDQVSDFLKDKGSLENCCGCGGCLAVCPTGALNMQENEEGFFYPVIEEDQCVHCGLCKKVCAFQPALQAKREGTAESHRLPDEIDVYAGKLSDQKDRLQSQSGGAFKALSDYFLEREGVVYGCIFDQSFQAVHARATDSEGRNSMRYSKYVQSYMGTIFRDVEKDLRSGKSVLFSGTTCQVAGLNQYLRRNGMEKSPDNLYTVDILCHGVPSPGLWREYLQYETRHTRVGIASVLCRNKAKFGWRPHIVTVTLQNGKAKDSRVFPKIFYSHAALRPSCYVCPYKGYVHPSDLMVSDFWGIEDVLPGFSDGKGVSLILVNSEKGDALLAAASGQLTLKKVMVRADIQKPLVEPYEAPANREEFWQEYAEHGFPYLAKKYGRDELLYNSKWKLRYFLKRKLRRG